MSAGVRERSPLVDAIWADGFGLWHADVVAIGSIDAQRERARSAIAAEVSARENNPHPLIVLGPTPPLHITAAGPLREWREQPA